MKDSTLKIAVPALLAVVFAAVSIAAQWVNKSNYDHISSPSRDCDEVLTQAPFVHLQSAGHFDNGTDSGTNESETTSAISWADLNGYSRDSLQQQSFSTERRGEAIGEETPCENAESPDKSNYVYGDDDVE